MKRPAKRWLIIVGLVVLMVTSHYIPRMFGVVSLEQLTKKPITYSSAVSTRQRLPDLRTYRTSAEVMPAMQLHDIIIHSLPEYPPVAWRLNITGTVYMLAYVDTNGVVVATELLHGIGGGCDETAGDTLLRSLFQPATDHGIKVPVRLMIPVQFQKWQTR